MQRSRPDGNWCAKDRHGHTVPGLSSVETNPVPSFKGRFACKVER
jgi:hypothetical protein